jgi:type I restriction enzyme, S subunit
MARVPLKDICEISWGDTTVTKASYVAEGYPAFSASGCDGFLPYFDHEGLGIVLSAIGARCGKIWFAQGQWSCIKNTIYIKSRSHDADIRYVFYATSDPDIWPKRGAAQPFISQTDARNVEIALPALPVQHRIAGILSVYDDLIENSQRRIKILEEMARALYREWFVHFRFPGHVNHPRIASPLGEIPQGWEVKRLGEIAEEMRRNVPKGQLEEPSVFVGLEHIPRRSLALDAWATTTELGSNKLEFRKGEVLFGKIRAYFHKVSVAPFDGLCSADTIVIRALRPEHHALMVACVSSDAFVAEASATSNGAKMPRASWEVLKRYPVVIPEGEVADKFSAFIAGVIAEQQTLIFQIQNLRRTRDLLLPRLLSGQIDMEIH